MKYLNQLKQLDKDQEAEGIMNWDLKAEIEGLKTFKSIGKTLERIEEMLIFRRDENEDEMCECGNRKMEESEFCKGCI